MHLTTYGTYVHRLVHATVCKFSMVGLHRSGLTQDCQQFGISIAIAFVLGAAWCPPHWTLRWLLVLHDLLPHKPPACLVRSAT